MNSRFAALMEETPIIKKDESLLKEKHKDSKTNKNHFRDYKASELYHNNKSHYSTFKRSANINEIKKEIQISLDDLEMFPSLSNYASMNIENIDSEVSFIDKVKMVNHDNHNEIKKDILENGWISLTRDKDNKIIYSNNKNEDEDEDEDDWNLITQKINDNYLLWKKRYIQQWGEDEFEKMYKFPNYDYEYFDKLDIEFEKEIAEMFQENNDDLSDNYDNYDYENDEFF